MDQRELVERAGRGDHDAFGQLVRERLARLDAAARLILHDPELARDAVQEALVGAWRDLPGLRDPDSFDAWIHRITVRSCLGILRRRRRRVVEVELTPMADVPVGDTNSFIVDRDEVERALRSLQPDQRAVVVAALLPGVAAAGDGRGARDSARDGEVPAASVACGHAGGPEYCLEPGSWRASARADRMSTFDRSDRFQQELPDILTAIAAPRMPDYVDDLLARAAATRQRPRWTFPERWLPMGAIARRQPYVPDCLLATVPGRRPAPRPRGGGLARARDPSTTSHRRSAQPATARCCSATATSPFATARRAGAALVGGPTDDFAAGFTRDGTRLTSSVGSPARQDPRTSGCRCSSPTRTAPTRSALSWWPRGARLVGLVAPDQRIVVFIAGELANRRASVRR